MLSRVLLPGARRADEGGEFPLLQNQIDAGKRAGTDMFAVLAYDLPNR